jgi:hypothetical protein
MIHLSSYLATTRIFGAESGSYVSNEYLSSMHVRASNARTVVSHKFGKK